MGNKQKFVYLGSVYDSWFLHRRKLKLSDEKFAELLLTTWLESLSLQEISSSDEIISGNSSSENCLLGSQLTTKSNASNQKCLANETCSASAQVNKENSDSEIYVYANIDELPKYEISINLEKLHINKTSSIPESNQLPTDQFMVPNLINTVQVKIKPEKEEEEEEECMFEASYESVVEESFLNERPSIVSSDNINWELFKGLKTEADDKSKSDIQPSTVIHSLPSSTFLKEEPCSSNNPSTTNQEKNKSQEGDLNFETSDSQPSETNIVCNSKKSTNAVNKLSQEQNHLNSQRNENKCTFKCKHCDKTFKRKENLANHVATHNKTKTFKCNICFLSFPLQRFLQNHVKQHIGKKSYSCQHCSKSFDVYHAMYYHQRTHNEYKCDQCERTFKQKRYLSAHMMTHTGIMPYECLFCHKGFLQKSNLISHIRKHTGEKPFVCNKCGKAFARNAHLFYHLSTHDENKIFKCNICPKAFTSNFTLSSHLRKHNGVKPYKCTICEKAFTDSRPMKDHLRIHTGEKPYSCAYCQKAFTNRHGLSRHTKIHT